LEKITMKAEEFVRILERHAPSREELVAYGVSDDGIESRRASFFAVRDDETVLAWLAFL
jgi:hypothetical protein